VRREERFGGKGTRERRTIRRTTETLNAIDEISERFGVLKVERKFVRIAVVKLDDAPLAKGSKSRTKRIL